MVHENRSHHHHNHNHADFVLIKQDDKFFSRLLSKEKCESSFRYYYCGGSSGSIPFVWESQPGTPKHNFSHTSLPPLTPPPSYQTKTHLMNSLTKQSKSSFFLSIFPKISSKRIITVSPSLTSPSVSSSCSSSFSMSSVPITAPYSKRRNYRSRSEIEEYDHHEKMQIPASPTSTLCFGCGIGNSKRFRVNYPAKSKKNVKRAFSSFSW